MAKKNTQELMEAPLDDNLIPTSPDPIINEILKRQYSTLKAPVVSSKEYGPGLDEPLIRTNPIMDLTDEESELVGSDTERANLTPEQLYDLKAADQTAIGDVGRFLVRTGARVGQELLHMAGTGLGMQAHVTQSLGGLLGIWDKPKDLGLIFDNAFNRGLDNIMDEYVYNNEKAGLKVYTPRKVQEGGLWDNISSSSFWASEGADAAGFFVSMMIPGMMLEKGAVGVGAKILGGLDKVKPLSNIISKIPDVVNKLDDILAATINTGFESASEASGVYKDIKKGLIDRGEDPDIANSIASDKAAKVFGTNLALLELPNLFMQKNLLGKFNSKATSMLEDVGKESVKLTGKVSALKSGSFWNNAVKQGGMGILSEGFFEEGLQTATQNYFTKQGLDKQKDPKGVFNELGQVGNDILGIGKAYMDAIPTTEMQKSIFLGGFMGGMGGSIGAYREYKSAQNEIYGNEGPHTKFGKKLSETKLGGMLFSPKQKSFQQHIDESLLTYTPEGLIGMVEKDDKGNIKLKSDATDVLYNADNTKLVGADLGKRLTLNHIVDDAQESYDKESLDRAINLSQYEALKPQLKSEAGVEYLKKVFIPQQSEILIKNAQRFKDRLSKEQAEELTPEKIEERKQELIQKVDMFKSIYDEVNNRHDIETQLKYHPKYKQERDNFMDLIKNNKIQGKLDIQFSKNKINDLENLTNKLIENNKFKSTSLSKLEQGDIVDYNGKKSIYNGKDEEGTHQFLPIENVTKPFTIKSSTKIPTEIPLDIKKLDANTGTLRNIHDNAKDIAYHVDNMDKATRMLDVIYDNKKAQKAFDSKVKDIEYIKKIVDSVNTFKKDSIWKDKVSGKKYKVDTVDGKPILLEEKLDDKGNPTYDTEVLDKDIPGLTNLLDNPEEFKKNFEQSTGTPVPIKTEPTLNIEPIVQENPVISDTEQVNPVNTSKYNVGDKIKYNNKDYKVTKIYPDGDLELTNIKNPNNAKVNKISPNVLEGKVETTNIDSKKADIERRRQKELNKIFIDDFSSSIIQKLFQERNAGKPTVIRKGNSFDIIIDGKHNIVNTKQEIQKLILKVNPKADEITVSNYGLSDDINKNRNIQFEILNPKIEINVKYDAELAALENNSTGKKITLSKSGKVVPQDVLDEFTKGIPKEGFNKPEGIPEDLKKDINALNEPKDIPTPKGELIPLDEDSDITPDETDTAPGTNDIDVYAFNSALRPLEYSFPGTANNPRIGKEKVYTGDPNSIKTEIAYNLIENTDNYKLKAFLPDVLFPNFEQESEGKFDFSDAIYVALVNNEGKLIGLNDELNELVELEGSLEELSNVKPGDRKFIYSAIRLANEESSATGQIMHYEPDPIREKDWYLALDPNLVKLSGQEYLDACKVIYDTQVANLKEEHEGIRKNIKKVLKSKAKNKKDVILPIIAKSAGIPNTKNEYGPTLDIISELENVKKSDIINKFEIKIAQKNEYSIKMGNTKMITQPGFTYLFNPVTKHIYKLDPQRLTSSDVTLVIDMLDYLVHNVNKLSKINFETLKQAETIHLEDGRILEQGVFGWLSDMIHGSYIKKGSELGTIELRSKDVGGNWQTEIIKVAAKDVNNPGKFILNPKLKERLNEVLPTYYHQVKGLKIKNNDPYIDITNINLEKGTVSIESNPNKMKSYKQHVLEDITKTNVVQEPAPISVELKQTYGGGMMDFTPPLFASTYLVMDLEQYKPSVKTPKVNTKKTTDANPIVEEVLNKVSTPNIIQLDNGAIILRKDGSSHTIDVTHPDFNNIVNNLTKEQIDKWLIRLQDVLADIPNRKKDADQSDSTSYMGSDVGFKMVRKLENEIKDTINALNTKLNLSKSKTSNFVGPLSSDTVENDFDILGWQKEISKNNNNNLISSKKRTELNTILEKKINAKRKYNNKEHLTDEEFAYATTNLKEDEIEKFKNTTLKIVSKDFESKEDANERKIGTSIPILYSLKIQKLIYDTTRETLEVSKMTPNQLSRDYGIDVIKGKTDRQYNEVQQNNQQKRNALNKETIEESEYGVSPEKLGLKLPGKEKSFEDAEDESDDAPFRRYKDNNRNYVNEDLIWARQQFAKEFSQFDDDAFRISYDLIRKGIFGQVANYGMTLDNLAEEGTYHHEAFHMVTHYLIPMNERLALYDEWRKRNKSTLSNKKVEEELAEDYRDYRLNGGKMKLPPIQENVFKKIWRWVKYIFNLGNPSIRKVFERMNVGAYSNAQIRYNTEVSNSEVRNSRVFDTDNPEYNTHDYHKQAMYATNVFFFENIRKELGSFDVLFNGNNNSGIINRTYDNIKKSFETKLKASKDFRNEIAVKFANGTATKEELQLSKKHRVKIDSYEFLLSQFNDPELFKKFKEHHEDALREYGLEDKFIPKSDTELDEDKVVAVDSDNSTGDSGYDLSDRSVKFNAKGNAQKTIKLLIGSLPELYVDAKGEYQLVENKYGLPTTIKFGKMFNTILQGLTKSKGLEEVIANLVILKEDVPSLQYFFGEDGLDLNKILTGNFTDIAGNKFNELMQFAQTFQKTEEEFDVELLNEGGNRVINSANTQIKRAGIKTKWKSNATDKILHNSKYFNKSTRTYNTSEFAKMNSDFTEDENLLSFLKAIGIEFTNWKKVVKQRNDEDIRTRALMIYNSIIGSNNTQINIFDAKEESNHGQNLTALLDIEYNSNIDVNELQHVSIDGEKVYNHVLNSYITNMLDTLNKFATYDDMIATYPHLDTANIDYVRNSLILKKGGFIFDEDGNRRINQKTKQPVKLDRSIAEGIREQVGGDSEVFSKLSKADKFASVVDRTLQGQFNLIRTADKSLERFIKMDWDKTVADYGNKHNIFLDYLKDEIVRYKREQFNGDKNEWNNYNKNVKNKQGIMLEMVKTFNLSPTYYEWFDKLLGFRNLKSDVILNIPQVQSMLQGVFKNYEEQQVTKYRKWLIDNKVFEYNKNTKEYTINGINYGKTAGLTEKEINDKLKQFLFRDTIMNIEQTKVLFGDPSMFSSIPDFFKRTGSFPGTKDVLTSDYLTDTWIENNLLRTDHAEGLVDTKVGAKLRSVDPSNSRLKPIVKMTVFNDPKVFDDVFKDIKEETDGYSMVSLDEAREMLFRAGKWGYGKDSLEDLYQWEMQNYYGPKIGEEGFLTKEEYEKLFPEWNGTVRIKEGNSVRDITERPHKQFNMLKPLHVGPYAEIGNHMGIVKTSFGILYPSSTKGYPNKEKMMNYMRKNQIGVVSFASANKGITTKLNPDGKIQELYNEQGELNLPNSPTTQNTYYENWGFQLETGFKNKEGVITGTQMMKQILGFMYSRGEIKGDFADIKGLLDEYITTNASRLEIGKRILLKELNVTEKDGNYVIENYDVFKSKLRDIADARGMDDNAYESIDFIEPTLGMDILLNRNTFENAIFGLNDSTVIKQKRKGGAYYQQPSTLYEIGNRTFSKDNNTLKSSDDLKAYNITKNKDGKDVIGSMQVLLPNIYKGIPIKELNDILKKGIAFRIPTQGLASIEAIEVVGFLSESEGDTIVLPSSIVKKAGSDYDIDKLNLYLPNYYINKKGEATYIDPKGSLADYRNDLKEGEKELSQDEFKLAQSENRITEIQREIILHPSNYANLTTPLDETGKIIGELAGEIYKLRTGNDRDNKSYLNVIDRVALTNVSERFLASKQAVGITALASPFHILAQMSDLYMNMTNEKGESNAINLAHNKEGNKILLGMDLAADNKSDIGMALRQWISEAVDAAKDPRMFDLNVNLETLNTVLYLTMTGVPTETVLYFINQPIIHDYIQLKDSSQSMLQAVNIREDSKHHRSKTLSEKEIVAILAAKYSAKQSTHKEDSVSDLKGYIEKIKVIQDKNEEVRGDLAETQFRILQDYLRYKKSADLLGEAMQGASWDTNSAGKSVPELILKLNGTNKVLRTNVSKMVDKKLVSTSEPVLGNYNELLEGKNSFIKPYYHNNKNLLKELSPLFKLSLTDESAKGIFNFLIKRFDESNKISKSDKASILDGYMQGYISSILLSKGDKNGIVIANEVERLFNSKKSVARELDRLQRLFKEFTRVYATNSKQAGDEFKANNPNFKVNDKYSEDEFELYKKLWQKYSDSPLLKSLTPNISDSKEYYDHIVMLNRTMDLLENSELVDSWNTMLNDESTLMKEFAEDLIKLSLYQTGIEYSPISFVAKIPAKAYSNLVLETMKNRSSDANEANYDAFKALIEYTVDNAKDDNVVPSDSKLFGPNKVKAKIWFLFSKLQRRAKDPKMSKAELSAAVKKGKEVYWDINPLINLTDGKEITDLPKYYKRKDGALTVKGRLSKFLIDSFFKLRSVIFENEMLSVSGDIVNKENNVSENKVENFSNAKSNFKDYYKSGKFNKIFKDFGIININQIDKLTEEESGELNEKLCLGGKVKFGR